MYQMKPGRWKLLNRGWIVSCKSSLSRFVFAFNDKLLRNDVINANRSLWGHYTFLGNCPPTPPLSQHFALSEKQVLMLTHGRGRWAVSIWYK